MAKHISNHMRDAVGATKDQFGKLQKAKLNYDMERENMQRQLSPVQSVINHVSQIHNLQPNAGVAPLSDPNNPGMQDDPEAMDPNNPQYDQDGNPGNMSQTVGKMNQSRPSLAGFQPGVAPGFSEKQVVPGKMGVPKPGQGNGVTRAGNPSQQYNKQAAPPKGNRSLPGAKGPGDPKVANRSKKAQNKSAREIKVHVSASSPVIKASRTIETQFGLGMLKQPTGIPVGTLVAAGTSTGAKKNWSTRGKGHLSSKEKTAHHGTVEARDFSQARRKKLAKTGDAEPGGGFPIVNRNDLKNAKRAIGRAKNRAATIRHINKRAKALGAPGFGKNMDAGPAQLSDKVDNTDDTLSYNPVTR